VVHAWPCGHALSLGRVTRAFHTRSLHLGGGGLSSHLLGLTDRLVELHRLPLVGHALHRRRLVRVKLACLDTCRSPRKKLCSRRVITR
jgi:hypothetical protein